MVEGYLEPLPLEDDTASVVKPRNGNFPAGRPKGSLLGDVSCSWGILGLSRLLSQSLRQQG